MDVSSVIEMFRYMVLNGLQIIALPLVASLFVAIVVGVVQAVMQIQEQTLSFFPKMLVLFGVIYWLGSWMLEKTVVLIQDFLISIPGMM
ncbi:flagellar biosynthetic protein FliQ (plasmid) [Pontibacillus sp. ALD_SL1]|uniref:flagellar biosynthetic protein FliQ n=1 Tax=Pontibacillus sp. ALD_SL1 TaxID=2777185 RepID=UPI001A961EFF|nr:flagellar biosynthetic protein FliQ [Pontibacillus sp. ALD_SL1]QST03048.1 flagellar biosynthetic protein FliQ [Pontibacillus sp. ALD_SL1]